MGRGEDTDDFGQSPQTDVEQGQGVKPGGGSVSSSGQTVPLPHLLTPRPHVDVRGHGRPHRTSAQPPASPLRSPQLPGLADPHHRPVCLTLGPP